MKIIFLMIQMHFLIMFRKWYASITMKVYNHSSFERTEKEVQRIDNVINF